MVAKTFERLALFKTMWPGAFRTAEILDALNRMAGDHVHAATLTDWARKAGIKRCPEMISLQRSEIAAVRREQFAESYRKSFDAKRDMVFGGLVFTPKWPKDVIIRLMEAWNQGKTTLEMERLFMRPKNAIVGKIHRLVERGLVKARQSPIIRDANDPRRGVRDRTREKTPVPKATTLPPLRTVVVAPVTPIRRFVMEPPVVIVVPVVKRVTPVERPYVPSTRKCQFPMWGLVKPTHVYCDAPVHTRSYCLEHSRLCYVRLPGYREQAA